MGQPKIQMPAPDFKNSTAQNYRAGYLIPTYGTATVQAAETSVVLDVLIMTGIIKPSELIELIDKKCQRIDAARRSSARLESDRG